MHTALLVRRGVTVVAAAGLIAVGAGTVATADVRDVAVEGTASGTTVSATFTNDYDEDLNCELLMSLPDGQPLSRDNGNFQYKPGIQVFADQTTSVSAAFTNVPLGTWSLQFICVQLDELESQAGFTEYWSSYTDPRINAISGGALEVFPPNQQPQQVQIPAPVPTDPEPSEQCFGSVCLPS